MSCYNYGTSCTLVLQTKRPSYRPLLLRLINHKLKTLPLAISSSPFSAAATSAKMPHWNTPCLVWGLYATKRGHALTATQPKPSPQPVYSKISTNHAAKFRSSQMPRQALRRSLVTCSIEIACMTLDADPLVSPWSQLFPLIGKCPRSFLESS
jgi:hypothetical protein